MKKLQFHHRRSTICGTVASTGEDPEFEVMLFWSPTRLGLRDDVARLTHQIADIFATKGQAEQIIKQLEKAERGMTEAEGDDDDHHDEGQIIEKLGPVKKPPIYPRDDLTDAMNEHRQVEDPPISRHVTQNPLRTRFDARVDQIAARDGVPKAEAMRRARKEYKADFIASQRSIPASYEDAVAGEVSKGCSIHVAKQRVMHSYGNTLPHAKFK
jgi:hypothetical protein